MSVLTKVFVVLLTLVSIALSMLVVSAFARQEDWRAAANQWNTTALAAQAKERAVSQNAALEQARAQDRHQKDVAQIAELQAQSADQERKIAGLERKTAEAENRLTVEQGTSAALAEQSKVFQSDVTKEREFSGKLAKRNSELERQSIDLTDRVKELTANVAMAQAQVRALQQQLAASIGRGATESAAAAGNVVEANVPSVQPSAAPEVSAPIRGEVTSVKGPLAEISVGSADGVAAGMRFLIYRPGQRGARPQYLGTLRITKVEPKQSAGQIEQSEGDIKTGDTVRDEASFAMRGLPAACDLIERADRQHKVRQAVTAIAGVEKMAQMPGSTGSMPSPGKAENDIYTVLVCTAFAIVVGTLAFVIYRCIELFGSPFPGIGA